MNSMRLTLARARSVIRLGEELGRGGEGSVFAIEGQSDHVAKVYTTPPDPRKTQKMLAMTEVATPSLVKIAAWPVDLAMDTNGRPRGFIMPRVSARRDIHELYGPKSRAEAFPEADFRFLVHVAANISRALAVVHEQGHVVGDVNHGNILVGPDGTVMLIDCDSFQVSNESHIYTCDVGVPLFTAPELHGRPFRGLERTANHDRFGLAVLLFHLLFMGRHPFAGRHSGAGEMPIERAIREYRFAYGPDRALHGMERPPGTVQLEAMGPMVAQLFIAAFGRDGANRGRPDAGRWVAGLHDLKSSLCTCSRASSHYYAQQLASCPWCEVERQTAVKLFGQRILAPGPTGAINVGNLWQMITSVPDPGEDPPLPAQLLWRRPPDLAFRQAIKATRKAVGFGILAIGVFSCTVFAEQGGVIWALFSYGLAYAFWPRPSRQRLAAAELALTKARTS